MAETGAVTPEVRQTENDERREDARARGGGAPAGSGQPAHPETTGAGLRWSSTPSGVRLSLEALTVDAVQAEVERGELKAVVSVRRGDELLYSERVNFDWSGGRDKFLRKSGRALATAGVATRITEALLAEMRDALRKPGEKPPSDPAAATARASEARLTRRSPARRHGHDI